MLAGFERGYGRPPSAAMSTSPVMRDDDDDDGGGGRAVREGELERLMRSLSEDMSPQATSQNHHHNHHYDYFMSTSAVQRDYSSSFSRSQPSFLLELLSMPVPAAGWNPNAVLPDAAPILHSTSNLHGFPGTDVTQPSQQRPQEASFWDALPECPSWFPVNDGLQELLTPAAWTDPTAVSAITTAALAAPKPSISSGISSLHSPLASPAMRSPSPPACLNSAASTLPSTPNSSTSSGSVSDSAAAEEDHSRSSSARPSSLQQAQPAPGPSDSSSAKRKIPEQNFDDDEIQSLDSKKP